MQGFGFADPECRRGLICCHCESPFSPRRRICINPGSKRREFFREECRDCFWPLFTHPEWLCCRTLYGCCRKEDPCEAGEEGEEENEERRRHHKHCA
jgi:hypothetical protein